MKKLSKLLALVLAMALCLALTPAAFAAGTGSITIENATTGQTYSLFKIFDATYGNGHISYLASDAQKKAIENISGGTYFEFTGPNSDGNYTVKAKGSETDIVTFLKAHITELAGSAVQTREAAGLEVKFTDLDDGYYYITSSLGTVVTVTSTNPAVTVHDKNLKPGWGDEPDAGKTVEGGESSTATIGDTVHFKIQAHGAAYEGNDKITSYTFTDTMSNGLTFNKTSVKVTISDVTDPLSVGSSAGQYELSSVTDQGFQLTIHPDDKWGLQYTITIEYTATLNENAVVGGTGNTNKAEMTWVDGSTGPDPGNEPYPEETKTYTYSFDLVKTDDANKLLDGAQFELYTDPSLSADDIVKLVEDGDGYRVATEDEITTNTGIVTTIEAGNVTIKGLGNGQYYLKETKAPNGYNILTDAATVNINGKNEDATMSGTDYTSGGVQVINEAGTTLPDTGGIGTTIFYVVGGALVLVAVVLLVTKKRMANKE